jgi:hypothetical protein
MTIAYPLSLPQARVEAAVTLRRRSAVAVTASPFTLDEQVQVWPGQKWLAAVSLRPMQEAEARAWIAFLVSLNGREGTFLMGDPLRPSPRGVGTGTPLVKGAGQTGLVLATDGWTAGQAGILKGGDYIQLGSGASATLHMVVADAASDGSGNATLDIWPRLRTAPADNAPVTVQNPMGRWRLASNELGWDERTAQFYGIDFACEEAL